MNSDMAWLGAGNIFIGLDVERHEASFKNNLDKVF